jgi:hypothetical protein
MRKFKFQVIFGLLTGLVLLSGPTQAVASVELKLIDGKKFSDYQLTGDSRSKSLERLKKDFTQLFEVVSKEYVSKGEQLEVDVTNVDLPGRIHYFYGPNNDDVRVVESNTPYRLYFKFRVKDAAGKVIKQGEGKIRDFSESHARKLNRRQFGAAESYHLAVKKWFKNQF